jgi:hypothetical protein
MSSSPCDGPRHRRWVVIWTRITAAALCRSAFLTTSRAGGPRPAWPRFRKPTSISLRTTVISPSIVPRNRPSQATGRRDTDYSALRAASAKECTACRAEFTEPPAGVDPLEHRGDEGALQIRARRQPAHLEDRSVHVAHQVPARVLGRLQGIDSRAAHEPTVAKPSAERPSSNPRRSKLYGNAR